VLHRLKYFAGSTPSPRINSHHHLPPQPLRLHHIPASFEIPLVSQFILHYSFDAFLLFSTNCGTHLSYNLLPLYSQMVGENSISSCGPLLTDEI
jgi:hypothetical protein